MIMIYETLIYAGSFVMVALMVLRYLKQSAELDADTKLQKTQMWANSNLQTARLENSAYNFDKSSDDGGLGQIGTLMSLLSNPQISQLLEKMKPGGGHPPQGGSFQ